MTGPASPSCNNCGKQVAAGEGLAMYGGWPASGEDMKLLSAFCTMDCLREYLANKGD